MDNLLFHCHVLNSSNPQILSQARAQENKDNLETFSLFHDILSGEPYKVIEKNISILNLNDLEIETTDKIQLVKHLQKTFKDNFVSKDLNSSLLLAIAFLQTFIQLNFTGPSFQEKLQDIPVLNNDNKHKHFLDRMSIELLSISGQPAYELCDYPFFLLCSLILLEILTESDNQSLLINASLDVNSEADSYLVDINHESLSSLKSLALWWRGRALLTQLSLLSEPTGLQPIVASHIFSNINLVKSITKDLVNVDETFVKSIYVLYYLENVKCSLAINTEHLCLPALKKAKKLTNFQFVLTGARAKKTKYQNSSHTSLLILAKSDENWIRINDAATPAEFKPASLNLDHEVLLEKPEFENIGIAQINDQIVEDSTLSEENGYDDNKLLPIALRQECIPADLKGIDPNNQPELSPLDSIQLLLRLYAIRQSTPAKDLLVEEELNALVSRVVYQGSSNSKKEWTIFSRSLWERSLIETTKAKTVQRGLLQMQSLVEELELKIKTTLIPQKNDKDENYFSRLQYIHQLPFIPRWSLDSALAERYMSMGLLRSAVEIYERLGMACEAALCYATVGDESKAEQILLDRVAKVTNDCRAYSILGDIKQDPKLWEKSWELGKYVNAKNSLGRYYYRMHDLPKALKHLNDSLSQYPLSFDTWYFYGCVALESGKMEVAAEAFSRCTALDDTHAASWSNLSAAYIKLGKLKEAHNCLSKALKTDSGKNWRIWENFLFVSTKLNEWEDVLNCCKQLVLLQKNEKGEGSIDIPVVEKLVELLVSSDYDPENKRLTYFQTTCIDFVCNLLPSVITTNARCWRLVARVELWRKRPWASLECHEKAYRAILHNPNLDTDENIWNETVDACEDLVAAYESLGDRKGKYGEPVCKDWKYKARSTIKSLISRGKTSWNGSDGWERLMGLRTTL
ncbi:related to Essential for maintenance of the cell wall protein 1 [Saccharomycodes ludwigii]|uniref:Related to Essential for maintenance of the cell wall protein 1 n=1 Tax=Saccharomycodes ludwigii TaxID=36035 RepID=A0A376B8M3_9ASCO|nr:hypothetical protein SCDLUD_005012 [Saccharomycodes ludwigii]KAH3898689.1 hypothetical protein SCDLUD_005012 [Saccharomycodes ludwigii]SSD61022.1 related to Essential for maintenance of the cell wall protein 1 [Saccharomycodes ludwigii]